MSIKAKALQGLYRRGKVTAAGLRKAVEDTTITADEYKSITGEEYQTESTAVT